jgi:uncharacterized protein YqjF (DUF2071 family)
MKTASTSSRPSGALSAAARERLLSCRGEPRLLAGWLRVLMIHYEVAPETLQLAVPFDLDWREGRAFVSLVAFTMRGLRLRRGGPLGRWLFRPIATHRFLNLRTYVRVAGEPGIHFLTEWLDNRLSVRLAPWPYGLPYRYARLDYGEAGGDGALAGCAIDPRDGARCRWRASLPSDVRHAPCPAGSLDEFLMERYTAFTRRGRTSKFFRVWHPPWEQARAEVEVEADELIRRRWPWFSEARLVGANYAPGFDEVWMSWPRRDPRGCSARPGALD